MPAGSGKHRLQALLSSRYCRVSGVGGDSTATVGEEEGWKWMVIAEAGTGKSTPDGLGTVRVLATDCSSGRLQSF